ncbi:alpha/beta fold hydrolase [Granulicella sp. L60]|uniref:alpha/beta fold hydrolase n=1 Tax=Granulicella sp. L60 TaxID=1641866 RepID=UPI00131BF4A4|nr:alpha/beta fold hydrolase [Granulicella sp. L60]
MSRRHWLPLLLLLPIAGIAYQRLGARRDRRRLLGRGTLIDVAPGRRMYLSQMGSGDGPVVVFESGIAATSQNWVGLQRAISSFARTVIYDRAGLGWSSPSPADRTPSNIVRELRTLLQRAGIPPPYLLVGHSFGALVARRYAAEHPADLAGIILIDAMRTADWPPLSDAQQGSLQRGLRLASIATPIARFGLARLLITTFFLRSAKASSAIGKIAGSRGREIVDRVTGEVGKMPRDVWPVIASHWSNPGFYRSLAAHIRVVPATVREMHEAPPIEGIPTIVLIAANAEPHSPEALRAIAPAARQIIAEESGHWIHLDQPGLVLEAIRSMFEEIRHRDSSPAQ